MTRHRVVTLSALAFAACGGAPRPEPRTMTMPVPSVAVGNCGTPGSDGVMSAHPDVIHADRDLDGDDKPEVVVADRTMCTPEGNCYWNVFVDPRPGSADRCQRYAGTLAAAALEPSPGHTKGEDNFVDLRGYWMLTSGGRMLLHEYRFRRGGYQIVDAVLCRRESDDRLLCESPEGQ